MPEHNQLSSQYHSRVSSGHLRDVDPGPPLYRDGQVDTSAPFHGSNSAVGPREVARLLAHRQEVLKRFAAGKLVLADLCLWSPGRPFHPGCTKIGGEPFLAEPSLWPRESDGTLFDFHFQVNFADSSDIVQGLPGDIVMVFRRAGSGVLVGTDCDDSVRLVWSSCSRVNDARGSGLGSSPFPEYFASLFRSEDLPDLRDRLWDRTEERRISSEVRAEREKFFERVQNCVVLRSSKIGGVPAREQGGIAEEPDETLLMQMTEIYSFPLENYFVYNNAVPAYKSLEDWHDAEDRGIHSQLSKDLVIGDMGLIYLWRSSVGEICLDAQSG